MQNSSFALEYLLLEVREHFFGLFYLVCPPDHGEGSSFKLGGFDAVIISNPLKFSGKKERE